MNEKKKVEAKLNRIAELNLRNEAVLRDSIAFKDAERNNDEIARVSDEVLEIMKKYQINEPVSSMDGTFIAYPKRVGMSGVDMERFIRTGLFYLLLRDHPECISVDLRKAGAALGMDLSGYAVRDAYTMYTISTDEDYKTVVKIIDEYRERNTI